MLRPLLRGSRTHTSTEPILINLCVNCDISINNSPQLVPDLQGLPSDLHERLQTPDVLVAGGHLEHLLQALPHLPGVAAALVELVVQLLVLVLQLFQSLGLPAVLCR